jgi:RNA polymerase sigma factor (sigma-70 family)
VAAGHFIEVLRYVRRVTDEQAIAAPTDRELLSRFVTTQDQAAFEILVARHGPMVLRLCHSILQDAHAAEDAFQASFLVLVRKAGSLRRRELVGNWLFGVALRVARRARFVRARRLRSEREGTLPEPVAPPPDPDASELASVLQEQIARLPERYRAPVVLCYLEGKSRDEAAWELGCSPGTVKGRLERARQVLRERLARRGLAPTAAPLALLPVPHSTLAAVPASLVQATVRAALPDASTQVLAGATVSPEVAALARGVLRAMTVSQVRTLALCVIVVLLTGLGIGEFARRLPAAEPAHPGSWADRPPSPLVRDEQDKSQAEGARGSGVLIPSQRDGILVVIGTEIQPGEHVPANQTVIVNAGGEAKHYRRLKVGEKVHEGQLLARVDDRLARDEVAIKEARVVASEADLQAAEATRDEARARYERQAALNRNHQTSEEDLQGAKLTWVRYMHEAVSKRQAVQVARMEVRQAQTTLGMYQIRSSVDGVIEKIFKKRGEAVKSLEPVFLIRTSEDE